MGHSKLSVETAKNEECPYWYKLLFCIEAICLYFLA